MKSTHFGKICCASVLSFMICHFVFATEINIFNKTDKNYVTARIKPYSSQTWYELGSVNLGNNVFNIPMNLESLGLIEVEIADKDWQVSNYTISSPDNQTLILSKVRGDNSTDKKINDQLGDNCTNDFIVNSISRSHPIPARLRDNAWPTRCYGGGFIYVHFQCDIGGASSFHLYGNAAGVGGFYSNGTLYSTKSPSDLIALGLNGTMVSSSAASEWSPGSTYVSTFVGSDAEATFQGNGGGELSGVGTAFFGADSGASFVK